MTLRLLAVLAVAGALPAAASADTVVQSLPGPTPVRTFAATAVLSVQDAAGGPYRLAVQRGNSPAQAVPGIAPADEPFDADIGPGPGGRVTIVFARCGTANRCRLAFTTPAGGFETAIRGSAGVDGFESAPTIWGNRIAFARRYAKGSERVYTRPLDAGPKVRSTRLPGAPARECEEVGGCRAVTDATVPDLELRRTTLAQSIRFSLKSVGICGEGQIRLVDTSRRTSRLVASTVCGLSGQTYVGPSLTATNLLYARTCAGDPGGCENHDGLAYRAPLAGGKPVKAPIGVLLTGFAATSDDAAVEVQAPATHDGNCTNHIEGTAPACRLARADPLGF